MKTKDGKAFLEALEELQREKGISKEELLQTVEQALLVAYKKNHGDEEKVEVEINRETGEVKLFEVKTIVADEDLVDAALELPLSEAQETNKKAKVGDIVRISVNCEEFRRNAIQNGKQIVIQKVREAEKQSTFEKFKSKERDIMNGIIRRIDDKHNVFIEFSGTEVILSPAEQSPSDTYRVGDRIKVYLAEVEKTNKYPRIIISRKNEGLIRKLFELEIPEITSGIIQIKAIAREAGYRSKVAVFSTEKNIDTVGACIGQRSVRIKSIVDELNGEKIDIVDWRDDPRELVSAVLSPAKVKSVTMTEGGMTARVIVDASQLSLAIGKNGQNARLAAKLTGLRVDIKTEDEEGNILESKAFAAPKSVSTEEILKEIAMSNSDIDDEVDNTDE